jgi:hypothetical protein
MTTSLFTALTGTEAVCQRPLFPVLWLLARTSSPKQVGSGPSTAIYLQGLLRLPWAGDVRAGTGSRT